MSGERVFDLMGARIVGIEVDGGLARLEVEHKGCDDDAATLLVRLPEIKWLYESSRTERHE